MEINSKETIHIEAAERKGTALRQALIPTEPLKLPSNFAHVTLRRIEHERLVRERRERIVALVTVTACLLLGIAAIGFFYGAALLSAFQTMFHQSESFGLIPAIAFCFLFFALLNHYLRRHYA